MRHPHALFCALLFACACASEPAPPVPEIDRAGLEPALVEAIDEAVTTVDSAPRSAASWGGLGMLLDVHGLTSAAASCYATAHELDDTDVRWPYFRAVCSLLDDQDVALVALDTAIRIDPNVAAMHVYRGRGLLLQGELTGAAAAYAQAMALSPQLVRAYLGAAKVALARDDLNSAVTHLQVALSLEPRSAEPFTLMASAQARLGDDVERRRYAELAAQRSGLEPLIDPLRGNLGLSYGVTTHWRRRQANEHTAAGRLAQARDIWLDLAARQPRSAEPHFELGNIATRQSQVEAALAHYAAALEREPNHARAQMQLGNALAASGDTPAAIAALEQALALDAELHEARGNLGSLLTGTGRVDEGIALLRQAADALRTNAAAQRNLGQALRQAGRNQEALTTYERALTLAPQAVRDRFEYGVVLAEEGRLADAAQAFAAVVGADSTRTFAHVNLARTLGELGRADAAIAACRRALAHMPGQPQLQNQLAWYLATAADDAQRAPQEALALARALAERTAHGVPDVLETLAAALAANGDYESALQHAESAKAMVADSATHAAMHERLDRACDAYRAGRPYRPR